MLQFVNGHIRQFVLLSDVCINTNNKNDNIDIMQKMKHVGILLKLKA